MSKDDPYQRNSYEDFPVKEKAERWRGRALIAESCERELTKLCNEQSDRLRIYEWMHKELNKVLDTFHGDGLQIKREIRALKYEQSMVVWEIELSREEDRVYADEIRQGLHDDKEVYI